MRSEAGQQLAALRRRDVPHTCPVCGTEFTGMAKSRFCSNRCKQREKNLRRKEMAIRFIIRDGSPVARIIGAATSGPCRYGWERCKEELNANREWNLVNARKGKISNNVKWQEWEARNDVLLPVAEEMNEREFLIR